MGKENKKSGTTKDKLTDPLEGLNPYTEDYYKLGEWIQERTTWDLETVRLKTRKFAARGFLLGYSVKDLLNFLEFTYKSKTFILNHTGTWDDKTVDSWSMDILMFYAAELARSGGKMPSYMIGPNSLHKKWKT